MKGSTAGARHLAESAQWMAAQSQFAFCVGVGSLMESVLSHWDAQTFARFWSWARGLPE